MQLKRREYYRIKKIIKETCFKCRLPELINKINWNFCQMYLKDNLVYGRSFNMTHTIYLNSDLWNSLSIKQQKELVVHEICHILDSYLNNNWHSNHKDSWCDLMIKCGYKSHPYPMCSEKIVNIQIRAVKSKKYNWCCIPNFD